MEALWCERILAILSEILSRTSAVGTEGIIKISSTIYSCFLQIFQFLLSLYKQMPWKCLAQELGFHFSELRIFLDEGKVLMIQTTQLNKDLMNNKKTITYLNLISSCTTGGQVSGRPADGSGQRGTPNTVATEVVVYDQRRIVRRSFGSMDA